MKNTDATPADHVDFTHRAGAALKAEAVVAQPAAAPSNVRVLDAPVEGSTWLTRERTLVLVLALATLFALYLCWRLLLPFLPAFTWAFALAVAVRPLHDRVLRKVGHPDFAAGLTVLFVVIALILPFSWVGWHMATTAQESLLYAGDLPARWHLAMQEHPALAAGLAWIDDFVDLPAQAQRTIQGLSSGVGDLVKNSIGTAILLLLTTYVLFYFLRDRRRVVDQLRSLVPLSKPETDQVFQRIDETVHATIYGTVMVSMIQGALGGLMFWFLGIPGAVLWGAAMGLLAIVPYLGAFVIWAPAALMLAFQGEWGRALLLTGWGTIVVGLIDNLLYPILVGCRLRMHSLAAFVGILGGLAAFGFAGVILGPITIAVTVALLDIWRRRTMDGRAAEQTVCQ